MNGNPAGYYRLRNLLGAPLLLWALLGLTACGKPEELPPGLSFAGELRDVGDLELMRDLTWLDKDGRRQSDQQIFDKVFEMIEGARRFILLDMFLYNGFTGKSIDTPRALSAQLTAKLVAQREVYPDLQIIVISDPVNTVYGGMASADFDTLRNAGIEVVITDLDRLRDSNPLYSFFWRYLVRPFGNSKADTLPNPFGEGRVSIRSWLRLINFKANHRKMLLTDKDGGWWGLVTSANPHDGSTAHGNIAVRFSGVAVTDLYATERAVLQFSGAELPAVDVLPEYAGESAEKLQILTESKIKQAVLKNIKSARSGDRLDLMMFYLSDRDVIEALTIARKRGVMMRLLLDPNKDAFGREKNGIPNRPVGDELQKTAIDVRWCDTHGEQCHSKTLLIHYNDGPSRLITGSANFTRRNLKDFNLETNVQIVAPENAAIIREVQKIFELQWNNSDNRIFSAEYEKYHDESRWKYWLYRFMEWSGMSTF